jgi:hypothetical protein
MPDERRSGVDLVGERQEQRQIRVEVPQPTLQRAPRRGWARTIAFRPSVLGVLSATTQPTLTRHVGVEQRTPGRGAPPSTTGTTTQQ